MSAFLVSKAHIDFLVAAAARFAVIRMDPREAAALGDALWQENYKSVIARYGPDAWEKPAAYEVTMGDLLRIKVTPVQAIKAVQCLDYQSCEHEEWMDSQPRALLCQIRDAAIHSLPGYEEAAWEVVK